MSGRPKEFDPANALDAAMKLFWNRGYEASSMADLVSQMKINRQSVYDTYGDKRALFMEALQQYKEHVAAKFGAVFSENVSPLTKIRNFFKALIKGLKENGGDGCFLTNTIVELAPHDAKIKNYMTRTLASLEQVLEKTLNEAISIGEIKPKLKPKQLARLLLTQMQGMLVLSKTNYSSTLDETIKAIDDLLTM